MTTTKNKPSWKLRPRQFAIAVLLLSSPLVMSSVIAKKPDTSQLVAGPISITAEPIRSFSKINPLQNQFGKLEFLGGLTISSPIRQFGGWSDIAVDPDGGHLLAVSDDGIWLTAAIDYNNGLISGLSGPRIGPLRALSGRALRGKRERDAEGLVLLDGTIARGSLLVSFERIHRIGHFTINRKRGLIGPTRYLKLPKKARKLRRNKGLESVALIRGGPLQGAIVTFAERPKKGSGNRPGWLLHQGQSFGIKLKDIGDFDITSAAGLPDGSLLILERRFRMKEWFKGMRIRLRRIKASELKAGAVIKGDILLEANSTHEIDNMEGLAVHLDSKGRPIVSMISDDNFRKYIQRTVILQFSFTNKYLSSVSGEN